MPDRLKGVDQHQDVQGQIIADVKRHHEFKQNGERDGQPDRKLSRQQEAHPP